MALKRMDNVGIVVESLNTAISFFVELGMKHEGRTTVEGEWAGRVTGLGQQRVEIAMMVTPDGHSRLELSQFLTPPVVADHRNTPVNALGYLRVVFTVVAQSDWLDFAADSPNLPVDAQSCKLWLTPGGRQWRWRRPPTAFA